MIKVTQKGCRDTELSPRIQTGKGASQAGRDRKIVGTTVGSVKTDVPKEVLEAKKILQRLPRKRDELFAERVKQVKEMIAKGEYEIDAREVAKSIIRTEIARQLARGRVQSMNIDLPELLAIREQEITAKKWWSNGDAQKKAVPARAVALSQPIDTEANLPSSTFSDSRIRC
ncbi:MAG TPA: flagellar biosynthesis anti-sigma factor FlgM [Candidatus Binatia bacterium]|nr:flagellar biosynthesis anti-sigma factor FlgM [Candidatus Binatia bacterium]